MLTNKSTKALTKDAARLEMERSPRNVAVEILFINTEQTMAVVRPMAGGVKNHDIINARIILTPAIYHPINITNYIGLLHGDPKNPIGVQLIPKQTAQPNISHGLSTSLYGTKTKNKQSIVGKIEANREGWQQKLSAASLPSGQTTVIKSPKILPEGFVGLNPITSVDPSDIIDDPGAYISVGEDEVRLIADFGNALIMNKQSGLSIMGKVNVGTAIQDVRIGGAWRFNPMMQFQIPSTAVTPIPTLIFHLPGGSLTDGLKGFMDAIISL